MKKAAFARLLLVQTQLFCAGLRGNGDGFGERVFDHCIVSHAMIGVLGRRIGR